MLNNLQLLKQSLPSLELIQAEKARRSLKDFIRQAWHVLEPTTPYVHGWHIDAICEHLTAVSLGQIQNLLINMPPRHAKSLIVSVFWPCWEWLQWPEKRWLFSSYGQQLSTRDSLKCRRLIQSPWYQRNFGHLFQLTGDQNQKTRFENTAQGYRIATSVTGSGTGEGGDRVVVDDPHNVNEGESDAVRESTLIWWDETMSTRLNDLRTGVKLIIMQRVNARDLSGHVLEQGGYDHLCLPAEYEGNKTVTSIGWSDPRKKEGQLLWPEKIDAKALAELKTRLGPYGTAGQLQQRPTPRGGGIIKRAIFDDKYYVEPPKFLYKIQSWDTAFKTNNQNDYSVCTTWGVTPNLDFYLLDRFKAKIEFPELKREMINQWKKHNPFAILVEDKASGQSLIQEMSRRVDDPDNVTLKIKLPVKPVPVDVDKITRVNAITTILETNVYLPGNVSWLNDYLDTLTTFPNGPHDDDVDSTSQALIYLVNNRPARRTEAMIQIFGR